MSEVNSYWSTLCELVADLRCWVRVGILSENVIGTTRWARLLTIPTTGYLESSGGPIAFRDIAWVEVSTKRILGGVGGRPISAFDITGEITARMDATQLDWEFRNTIWSIEGVFIDEPVTVIRVGKPV